MYRKNFLRENTTGLIPYDGYTRVSNHSQKCVEWLLWEEKSRECEIIHAGRSREYVLKEGPRVDGYLKLREDARVVFQFHGCCFHGCPHCFPNDRDKILTNNSSFQERSDNTVTMSNKIKSFGYELIEMWECDFDRDIKTNLEFCNYIKNHPLAQNISLNPRDAFYGGRTCNIVTYFNAQDDETIIYYDVCSLYPFICKTGVFPIGHPDIFVGDQC